jgi:hypothetical protein
LVVAALVVVTNPGWLNPVIAAPSLFATDAVLSADTVAQVNATLDRGVMRSRLVALDANTLPNPMSRPQLVREPSLSFELFPDVYIVAVFDRFDPNTAGVTWVGHVEAMPGSSVTLAYSGRLLTGSIITPTATFQIRPAPEAVRATVPQASGEVHVIEQVNQAAYPRGAEPIVPAYSPEALATADARLMADSGGTIDVMVVYTSLAQQWAGGAAGVVNLINLGISQTNTSYANSDVKQRVRLVHSALVPYAEVSSFSTNLNNLRQGGGTLSSVPALRDQYRADLVMLFVHPSQPDFCGIAYLMANVSTAFASSAFSVSDTQCVSPVLVMAHEWGHNMGALHDWYVSPGVVPYTYAHGYANWRSGQRWRTVMSYNDVCAVQGFNCARLLAWANPDAGLSPFCAGSNFMCRANLWYVPGDGGPGIRGGTRTNCQAGVIPTQDCDADDHRTLNNTALTVANFRQLAPSTASRKR